MKTKKRIAINATFIHDNPTGLGVYTHELLSELLRLECDFDFIAYSSSEDLKRLFPSVVKGVSPCTSPALRTKGHLTRFLWEQTVLPMRAKLDGASLIYSTVPEGIFWKSGVKQIVTVHDIIPAKYPELLPKMKYHYYYTLPMLLRNSSAIICDSENTKKDVMDYYRVEGKPIYVIYAGFDRKTFSPAKADKRTIKERYGLDRYYLYVGDIRPYKNLKRALEAFASLDDREVKFVIAGRKDPRFFPEIEKTINGLSLKDRVFVPGYFPGEDLPQLYSEALAFVFPSLYEGFGLTPLEAMASGCPVVASNAASIPEVCGDAAYYIDPYSPESIAEGMSRVAEDEALRQNLIAKGFERAKLFSWKKAAQELIKVFEAVTGARSTL